MDQRNHDNRKLDGTVHHVADGQKGDAMKKDVTKQVNWSGPDDECLPITKCVFCGATFEAWTFIIGIYSDNARCCEKCGRGLIFEQSIRVYEVKGPDEE